MVDYLPYWGTVERNIEGDMFGHGEPRRMTSYYTSFGQYSAN